MTEKQASSEIAESRERFEKFGREVFLYSDGDLRRDDIGNYRYQEVQAAWLSHRAAERDTRERVAKLVDDAMAQRGLNLSERRVVAELIRGKE